MSSTFGVCVAKVVYRLGGWGFGLWRFDTWLLEILFAHKKIGLGPYSGSRSNAGGRLQGLEASSWVKSLKTMRNNVPQ